MIAARDDDRLAGKSVEVIERLQDETEWIQDLDGCLAEDCGCDWAR